MNRGLARRPIFLDAKDYKNFLFLLKEITETFSIEIHAYSLMPNHYHLLLKEIVDDGITSFMRKVGTAYTMYFNQKNERTGHLFSGPFRAKRIGTDRYFQHALRYIHCNPAELYERGWKIGRVRNMGLLERKLIDFPYSSLKSFVGGGIPNPILSRDGLDIAEKVSASAMLRDARDYYASEMKPDEV